MFDINKCYDCFATEPNSAYFWSGLGENGQDIAAQIAQENGGTTLEMMMDKNKDDLISAGFPYDEDLGGFYFTPENAQDWQIISQAYAEQANGNVHAVLGENIREESVWNTKELPALEKNDNVDKVFSVDPSTGKEKDIILEKNNNINTSSEGNGESYSETGNFTTSEAGGGARAPNTIDTSNSNAKRGKVEPATETATVADNNITRGKTEGAPVQEQGVESVPKRGKTTNTDTDINSFKVSSGANNDSSPSTALANSNSMT